MPPPSFTTHKRAGRERETLPMTTADATSTPGGHASSPSFARRRKRRPPRSKAVLLCPVASLCLVVFVAYHKVGHFWRSRGENFVDQQGKYRTVEDLSSSPDRKVDEAEVLDTRRRIETPGLGDSPLAKFSTLSHALAHTDLVGLYFAASWCPMSTPVTEALEDAFSDQPGTMLSPGDVGGDEEAVKKPLAIVYVSSDNTEEEMKSYSRKEWIDIPYASDELVGIKTHFRVCAKKELNELGFERKYEIPTLIVIDSVSHGILTTNGVSDLKEYGEKALKHWLGLQQIVRAMEEKYENEEKERQKRPEPRVV